MNFRRPSKLHHPPSSLDKIPCKILSFNKSPSILSMQLDSENTHIIEGLYKWSSSWYNAQQSKVKAQKCLIWIFALKMRLFHWFLNTITMSYYSFQIIRLKLWTCSTPSSKSTFTTSEATEATLLMFLKSHYSF